MLCALAALSLAGALPAQAVDLKDCSRGGTRTRLACLDANIRLLNSSHQTVAAEVRGAVTELRAAVSELKGAVSELKGSDAELKAADAELRRTDTELKATDAELRRTDAELKAADAALGRTDTELKAADAAFTRADGELKASDAELRSALEDLKKQVAAIPQPVPPPPAPDLSGVVRYGAKIRLRSGAWGGKCLDHDTHNADHVQGWDCNDSGAQDWTVEKR